MGMTTISAYILIHKIKDDVWQVILQNIAYIGEARLSFIGMVSL